VQDLEARRGICDARRVAERRDPDPPRAAQVASAHGNELVSDAQLLDRTPQSRTEAVPGVRLLRRQVIRTT
jgi:hypothetical protein